MNISKKHVKMSNGQVKNKPDIKAFHENTILALD